MKVTHRPLFNDSILKSSGEVWAHKQRILAPEFFPDRVKAMVALMVHSATSLVVKSWEDRMLLVSDGMELKVDDDLRAYSADVISRTCFESSYDKEKRILAVIRELQKTVSQPNLLSKMTSLSLLTTRSNRTAWRLDRLVHDLILDVVRENNGEEGSRNLLNTMLRSAALDMAQEDSIVDNCRDIYFAGYETTAVTTACGLMLLALHLE
jgi:gibberellin 13-oxidase